MGDGEERLSGRAAKRPRAAAAAEELPRSGAVTLRAEGESTEALARRVLEDEALGAGVSQGYVALSGGDALRAWAKRLCALGEPAQDELVYWESYKALPGEDVRAQLRRQLREDFNDMAERLAEEGTAEAAAAVARKDAGITALCDLVDGLLDLYEGCPLRHGKGNPKGGSVRRFVSLVIEVNQEGNLKFHEEGGHTDVRFVVPIVGGGPVLANPDHIDWALFHDASRAPLVDDAAESSPDVEPLLRDWNGRLCTQGGEVISPEGSLVVFKGGALTSQPCLRRSPYAGGSQDAAAGHRMLLVTVDHVTEEDMARLIEMHLPDDEDEESEARDEEEVEEGEEGSGGQAAGSGAG
mmetsp:Transcript_49956/g.139954  ORF Transcript_49956/g.139954 Transcript_49956/m.139954 type:complete len:353 (-) Transcript_49956:108-1166(-)|eukprot:CAMPEP_0117527064 /NCGR_PEP_ID=MMETSP0784-20121206/36606_1 /TAXON_ID=39447 /ORGANISM="" /LENGTH=352 /DNA_ID=CAMNT_0005323307 /DNA_START=63 /DNA_END=1121 /DNA_ORIENTATION=-